jgi:hypothetical protein
MAMEELAIALLFIDEAGDPGFKFDRGSSLYFTLALVMFESDEAAIDCQRSIETLKQGLRMPDHYEFHFHNDTHKRRLQFLEAIHRQDFTSFTLTLNKQSKQLNQDIFRKATDAYRWICTTLFESVVDELRETVISAT